MPVGHRIVNQLLRCLIKEVIEGAAVDAFLTNFQQYGDSERADSVEAAMGDAALHAAQHVTKPSYVS